MQTHNYHVLPSPKGGWDVKKENALRANRHFDNQKEAIELARGLSQKNHSELVIHGRDGKILRKDSHGKDPFPPKG